MVKTHDFTWSFSNFKFSGTVSWKKKLKMDSVDKSELQIFFNRFDEKYVTSVPYNIKKTLELMEYSPFSLSGAIDEELVAEMEETASSKCHRRK